MAESVHLLNANEESINDHEFIVHLKIMDNEPIPIIATKTDTIETIKQRLCDKTGTAIGMQRYVYRGMEMENHHKLTQYSINKETTIHAAIRRSEQELSRQRQNEFAYMADEDDDEAADRNDAIIEDDFDPFSVDRPFFDFLTCCTAYCTLCCILPILACPDIIALNVVNNWNINYIGYEDEWAECIWNDSYTMSISVFLNLGSLWSIISYSLFGLWFFWYLKTSSFLVMNQVRANQIEWKGLIKILASTKVMNLLWYFLWIGLLILSLMGTYMHGHEMSVDCQYSEIGMMLVIWSGIHFLISFIICSLLCMTCCCFMTSDNIFAHVNG